MSSSDEEMSEE